MSKYLVVKCEELGDQYECDANRTPMFMCDSWEDLALDYAFEVWEPLANGRFVCVRSYDDAPANGSLILAYFPDNWPDDSYIILDKQNITFNANMYPSMPAAVEKIFNAKLEKNYHYDDEIFESDYDYYNWAFSINGKHGTYVYGTYANGRLSTPW